MFRLRYTPLNMTQSSAMLHFFVFLLILSIYNLIFINYNIFICIIVRARMYIYGYSNKGAFL